MEFRGNYWFLSNFYPCRIKVKGIIFPSVEHAFQAFKSLDPNDWEKIASLKTPADAKRLGKRLKLRSDWNEIKLIIMETLLKFKFQYPHLMQKLKEIKSEIIEDNWWNDRFWGKCNGRGDNRLGMLLMEIRDGRDYLDIMDLPPASP